MLDFLRELLVSFSGAAKAIVKSGTGVNGLKVADLFEEVVGVYDVEKVRLLCCLQEYSKIFHGDEYVKDCNLSLLRHQ